MRRMDIRERMRVGVPAPITEVEAADAGTVVVNHDDLNDRKCVERSTFSNCKDEQYLLMMGPELNII